MSGQSQERRYPRVKLVPRKWVAIQGAGRKDSYLCPVMGLGGLFLECPDPFPVGSVVRFALQLRSYVVRGTASTCDTSTRGMGLAFLSFKTGDRAKIHGFLMNQSESRI